MNLKKILSGMFLAAAIATGSQLADVGSAEASDVWICSSYGNDYYVITESVHYSQDWYAKVKIVKDGKLQQISQYRFVPVDDDVSVSFIFNGRWNFLGRTSSNDFAATLWNKAVVPYM